jgi:hypothetical protein
MSLALRKILNSTKKAPIPEHYIVYDVESRLNPGDDGKTWFNPFLWTGIYIRYRRKRNSFQEVERYGFEPNEFWGWVDSMVKHKKCLYLMSHHLEVDFIPLEGFKYLSELGWTQIGFIAHNKVVIMTYKNGDRKLVIMNSGNLFPGSIASWGKILKTPKLQMPKETDPIDHWITYCQNDTKILAGMIKTLINFIVEHDLGGFKTSLASMAMSTYRYRFMPREIVMHNHLGAQILEHLSYHGGRFQAFKIGEFKGGNYYKLDINSMYASIQIQHKLPYQLAGYLTDVPVPMLKRYLDRYAVIADVDVYLTEPCLPVKQNDKCVYPMGELRTVCTTPELNYLIDHDMLRKVHKMAYYYQDYIMADYAQFFSELKVKYDKEGNQPMRAMAKLFPNSLYGKFGQHGYSSEIVGECDPDELKIIEAVDAKTSEKFQYLYYGGKIHRETETDVGAWTFTAIPAHITAYGRIMLWELCKQAGLDHVYHVATDSLIVDQEGYNNLQSMIHPTQIGLLKLEENANYIELRDVNDYIFGEHEKIKGVPDNAVRLSRNTYIVTTWPRITTLIKEGSPNRYYTKSIKKTLKREKYLGAFTDREKV